MNATPLCDIVNEVNQFASDSIDTNNHDFWVIVIIVFFGRYFDDIGNFCLGRIFESMKIVDNEFSLWGILGELHNAGHVFAAPG
ncbi:hypothetical protein WL96_13760 [Burkholderia vietnamiensis]|nr:hypothetical protein WL96_13760 [Burkholderia vietnamiensis]